MATVTSPGKWQSTWHLIKRNRWAYVFIAPFFLIFFIFGLFPPLYGLVISFFKWDLLTPMEFMGFANYARVFRDNLFWLSVGNVFLFTVAEAIPEIVISLGVAYLLDTFIKKWRNVYLAAFFSPTVTSSVAVSVVFSALFGLNYGVVNAVLRLMNQEAIPWLTEPGTMKIVLIVLLLWRWLGWNMVIYLAGLQTIPREYYEAALVDGANRLHILLKITIPLLKSIILYTVITATIGTLQLFAEPRLLSTAMGGRNNSLLTPLMYIYQMGFGSFRFGYASAIAYVLFIIILGASILNIRLLRRND